MLITTDIILHITAKINFFIIFPIKQSVRLGFQYIFVYLQHFIIA